MNEFFEFLKANNTQLVLLTSIMSLLLNFFISTINSYSKRKNISISNLEILMKSFFNYLYINKDKYSKTNKKIFTNKKLKQFFINNAHLFDYNIRVLLIEILKLETYYIKKNSINYNDLEEKYIKSKKTFFKLLSIKYEDSTLILYNEISLKNVFWLFPPSIRFIFLSVSTYLTTNLVFFLIQSSFENFLELINIISFIVFIAIIIFIFVTYSKFFNKNLSSSSKFYIFPKWLLRDQKIYCCRCKKYFLGYRGIKFNCPKNHKFSFFYISEKNINLFSD